jgi:8-oxo-dGTP pyrophosphatase MutT (NUDIX family)
VKSEIVRSLEYCLERYPDDGPRIESIARIISKEAARGLLRSANKRFHVTCSAIVLSEQNHHILTVYNDAYKCWLQPGGHLEERETLLEAAIRELREETGLLSRRIHPSRDGLPIDVDLHRVACGGVEATHLDFRFQFEAVPTTAPALPVEWVAVFDVLGGRKLKSLARAVDRLQI